VADFLEVFHEPEAVARARDEAQSQQLLFFIPEERAALSGLAQVASGIVRAAAKSSGQAGALATV
jgi:hypothetical protein